MDQFSAEDEAANALLAMRGPNLATALEVGDLGALAGPYKAEGGRRTGPGALPLRGAPAAPSSGVPDMNSTALVKIFESVREDDHAPEIEINKNSDLIEFIRPRGRIRTPNDTEENFSRPNAPIISSSERARGSNQMLSFSRQRATPSDHRLGQIATIGTKSGVLSKALPGSKEVVIRRRSGAVDVLVSGPPPNDLRGRLGQPIEPGSDRDSGTDADSCVKRVYSPTKQPRRMSLVEL